MDPNRLLSKRALQPSGQAVQPSGQAIQPSGRQDFAKKIKPDQKLLTEALRR